MSQRRSATLIRSPRSHHLGCGTHSLQIRNEEGLTQLGDVHIGKFATQLRM